MKPMSTLNGYEITDKVVREKIANLEAVVEELKVNGGGTIDTSGTAMASDILDGMTAWVNGVKLEGTMPNNAVMSEVTTELAPGSLRTIEKGYHSGMETLSVKTMEELTPASAVAEDILTGKTAWVNGELVDGALELNPTIENGFTVNFFDKDKTFIESHSALYNMYIDKPISYEADNWEHANGAVVAFPLTIEAGSETSVYNLYAAGLKTCTQQLYAHFGVDIALHPVLVIGWISDASAAPTVAFAQSYTTEYRSGYRYIDLSNCIRVNTVVYSGSEGVTDVRQDALKTTKYIVSTYSVDDLTTSELVSVMGGTGATANYVSYIHTNDDYLIETAYTKCDRYDLDATTYEV